MRLYILSIEDAAKIPGDVCARLFPKRLERAKKFRFREDYLRCIGAGILLEYAGICEADIIYNAYGKPEAPGVFFSLSHSGKYALLAADSVPVGADIEKNVPFHRGVAERVFTPEELAWMELSPEKRFYELWTLKESVSKLDGRGLQMELGSFSALPLTQGKPIFSEKGLIYGKSTPFDDCTVSVCSEKPVEEIVLEGVSWQENLTMKTQVG